MSKLEPELPNSPVIFYCLYRLTEANVLPSSGTSSPHSSIGSAGFSSSSFASPVAGLDSSDNTDLEIIATDLHEEWEKQLKLKKHIQSKFARNATYESGSVILLPTLVAKSRVLPPAKCYWCTLKGKDSKKYILCLVSASEAEGFNLFRYDMEKYAKRLESDILATQNLDSTEGKQALVSYLTSWYNISIDFISRTSLLLSEELDVLIHSCLMGHKIEVKSMMPLHGQLVDDTVRLIECIQLPISSHESDVNREAVTIIFDHSGKATIDVNETNEFCREWAARLIQAGSNRLVEAIQLRGWIEVVKLQLTSELNHIRKLSEAAVVDNYALYEAFLYLKNNPNKDVLLVLLMKEMKTGTGSAVHSKEVLHAIFKCLTTPSWTDHHVEDASRDSFTQLDELI